MRKVIAALAIVFCLAQSVDAATLSGVKGRVLVNKGNGFVQAEPGMQINPGDRVMVQPGGNAQVTYPNGAVGSIQPGGIFTLPATPPPVAAPGATGVAGAAGATTGITTGMVVAGIAVLGAGGWLISEATKSEPPRSP